MALTKCSECGKDISDTSEKCIHCGCPIERKRIRINKKFIIAVISFVVLLFVVVGVLLSQGMERYSSSKISTLLHTTQNTQLMRLIDYTSPTQIKEDLGDYYGHRVWESLDSTSDEYEDIIIDGKEYAKVEISYESNGDYERIYLDSNSVWTEKEIDILVKDFIKQYGNEYNYKEDEYNGGAVFAYSWKMSLNRRISLSIHQDKDDNNMFWVRINSFHN